MGMRMGIGGERDGAITAGDVDMVRARLRRSAEADRAEALELLRSWRGRPLGPGGADAVLRAATVGYPWVAGRPDDPGELLVQLLWDEPHQVPVLEVERSYVRCAERARRALLHLLARRADAEAVDVVGSLIGIDGPWDLLPVPTAHLLSPLLDAPGVERLAGSVVTLARRRGWSQHAAELIGAMARRGLLDDEASAAVAVGLDPLVSALVDTCDRATLASAGRSNVWSDLSGPEPTGADLTRADLSRAERRRLGSLLPLLAQLPVEEAERVLLRALSSADPRVAALAAVGLARRGVAVPAERMSLLGRDAEARGILVDGLGALGRHFALPPGHLHQVAVAESELIRWLASETQMGSAPDEVEHRGTVPCPSDWGDGVVHVFGFRVRPPHWSAARGWMLGAVGPFDPGAEFAPRRAEGFTAHSLYLAEDCDGLDGHVRAIAGAVLESRDEAA